MAAPRGLAPPQQEQGQESETVQVREFKGVNVTDGRTAIDDDEFAWLENAMTIGRGALRLVPKEATPLTSVAAVSTLWGFVLGTTPNLYVVNTSGGITQFRASDGAAQTVCSNGTVTSAAKLALWRNTTVLILDPTNGYFSWDGTTFTTIDATKVGTAIAVFEGRAWLANGRTITITAPNTFNDFTAANGATSTILTDEAFIGNIIALYSAFEQLWVVGPAAVNTISNVNTAGTPLVTTFSNTNIVTNVGSTNEASVIGYFRSLTFLAPFGIYALVGVTPQKLSDKLDGLFPSLTLTPDTPAAIGVINNLLVLCFLVTFQDTTGPRPLLLCFTQGKWFFASQGSGLKWITTLVVNGQSQVWGSDGSTIYQLFAASATTAVSYTIKAKLYDFGQAVQPKTLHRFGLEFQSNQPLAPTITIETERTSIAPTFSASNTLTWIGVSGAVLTFLGAGNNPIVWKSSGLILANIQAPVTGHYLGWDLTGTDAPWTLSRVSMEIAKGGLWN